MGWRGALNELDTAYPGTATIDRLNIENSKILTHLSLQARVVALRLTVRDNYHSGQRIARDNDGSGRGWCACGRYFPELSPG